MTARPDALLDPAPSADPALPTLIDRLLRPHPNALAIERGNGRPTISGGAWFPLINLIWLVWVFIAPWLSDSANPQRTLLTYATVPLFLGGYLRAWYGDRRHARHYTAAIAALALLTVPLGTTVSYLIYTGALLPFVLQPRAVLLALAAVLAVFVAVAMLAGAHLIPVLGWTITTAAITALNLFFAINTRRDAELRLSQQEVRRLAATAERERIGRDLHDLLGHSLSLIAMKSELADRLFDRDPDAARGEVRELRQIARESLAEVRAAVTGFRATGLAAERVSARLLLASGGTQLHGGDHWPPLPADIDAALALCLREAVTNIHRHAAASEVDIDLRIDAGSVWLRIDDNGRGGIDDGLPGNGLRGIRERLAPLGGRLDIRSPRGGGTRLELCVPLAARGPAA